MRRTGIKILSFMILLFSASLVSGEHYLYKPEKINTEAIEASEGILVKEVTVKRGETLSHISKEHSNHGYYYPQILLFNQIKNPHLIHPGQILRVPVSQKSETKRLISASKKIKQHKTALKKPGHHVAEKSYDNKKTTVTAAENTAFRHAMAAFNKGECDNAIKLFDTFINSYPNSSMMPDATLNRAECYLKLSKK